MYVLQWFHVRHSTTATESHASQQKAAEAKAKNKEKAAAMKEGIAANKAAFKILDKDIQTRLLSPAQHAKVPSLLACSHHSLVPTCQHLSPCPCPCDISEVRCQLFARCPPPSHHVFLRDPMPCLVFFHCLYRCCHAHPTPSPVPVPGHSRFHRIMALSKVGQVCAIIVVIIISPLSGWAGLPEDGGKGVWKGGY